MIRRMFTPPPREVYQHFCLHDQDQAIPMPGGIENASWLVRDAERGIVILRATPRRSLNQVGAEIEFADRLRGAGFRKGLRYMRGHDGGGVVVAAGVPWLMYRYADGHPSTELSPYEFDAAVQLLDELITAETRTANMPRIARPDFPDKRSLSEPLKRALNRARADGINCDAIEEEFEGLADVSALFSSVIIHCDVHPGNLPFSRCEGVPTLLDNDDACYGHIGLEWATAVRGLAFDAAFRLDPRRYEQLGLVAARHGIRSELCHELVFTALCYFIVECNRPRPAVPEGLRDKDIHRAINFLGSQRKHVLCSLHATLDSLVSKRFMGETVSARKLSKQMAALEVV